MAKVQASVVSGVFNKPFAEQVSFFRNKLGNLVPSTRWDDLKHSAHDRGFMVAGAAKADLLADLAAAVDRGISEGQSFNAFRKDFRAIVKQRGWHDWTGEGSKAGRAWRTRIIYDTNMNTSYAAGRLAQLREGGFAYWVYNHNDSVAHPRPLHLAWNGMVISSDALWWKSHYPPNGFGCRCYVSGARSKDAARRLGGDPNKKPDPAWLEIDPKTDAPVGIGKGWDYAPGDHVSDVVQTMARKTQQWEYSLAKAYMQEIPLSVRDDLVKSYRALPSVADDVRRYAASVLKGRDVAPYRTIGLLTAADAAQVDKLHAGMNVSMFDYALDKSTVDHVLKKHGTAITESPRGQRPVVAADYARIPVILNSPDNIEFDPQKKTGKPFFLWIKVIDGERFTLVFDVRKGRKTMGLYSMRIKTSP